MDRLLKDPKFAATTYVVIDFEALTPTGRPPVPIEVAAVAGTFAPDGRWQQAWEFQELIRPPDDIPLTPYDSALTGISADMLVGAASADAVMADLDAQLNHGPYRLVAHSANTEATLIAGQRDHCPALAATPLLCTVKLGRLAVPELASHRLDALARYLRLAIPIDRHRAMPDVRLTVAVFQKVLAAGAGRWATLLEVERDGGVYVKQPAGTDDGEQDALF